MVNWDVYSFYRDLSAFISLARKFDLPMELESLSELENYFQHNEEFKLDANNIVFTIDKKISGTIPSEIELIEVIFTHKCEIDYNRDVITNDLISVYDFQIQIKAYDSDCKEYINWWHLDKNIPSSSPKFTHPYYHFQIGGNAMEMVNSGEVVFLGSPRLPHPPMDLFLGIHFIINNFFSSKDYKFVKELLENDIYKGIIINAQKRVWDNYFNSFNTPNAHLDFNKSNVFPLYIN
tara:strand:+ start:868 stop:1572 length:705 start_codon:yes stop_codon:yes gene_type:complete